jgi:hypothetical protein
LGPFDGFDTEGFVVPCLGVLLGFAGCIAMMRLLD